MVHNMSKRAITFLFVSGISISGSFFPNAVVLSRGKLLPRRSAVEEEIESQKRTSRNKVYKKSEPIQQSYDAGQITVLSGLDPVRKRPGMYIGSTGPDGLHHLVWEVVDNSVDEALAGHASFITTTINEDGSCTVVDDGRGIPTDVHPKTGRSALETVLTVLHAGGKFQNAGSGGYKVSGGLHGVGISVVNALSSFVDVDVARNGMSHRMRFEGGVATGELEVSDLKPQQIDEDIDIEIERLKASRSADLGEGDDNEFQERIEKLERLRVLQKERKTGTKVTFLPDTKVFKGESGEPDISFDPSRLSARMDEIAYLNAGLLLTLKDKRAKKSKSTSQQHYQIFYHAGGLSEYAALLCQTKTPLFQKLTKKTRKGTKALKAKAGATVDPVSGYLSDDGATILCSGESNPGGDGSAPPVSVSVALRWSSDMYSESILSFCNNIRTRDGGSHVEGLKTALTRTVNQIAKRTGKVKEGASNLPGEFIREGLTAILSVSVAEPEFEGQTKGRLGK